MRLIYSYLTNRKQRIKVNLSCSPWEEILFAVPQGSILGPLLLNIFLCDLIFKMNKTDLCSYADDSTPYRKANTSKYHLLLNKKHEVTIRIGSTEIENSEYKKLLGIKVNTKLNFNEHL